MVTCLSVNADLEVRRCLFHDKLVLENENKVYFWDKVSCLYIYANGRR